MKKNFDFDEFEKAARDAFQDFEMPYEPKDWKRMEAHLDQQKRSIVPRLWLYKTLEYGVMVLAAFTLFNVCVPCQPEYTPIPQNPRNQQNTAISNGQFAQHNASGASAQNPNIASGLRQMNPNGGQETAANALGESQPKQDDNNTAPRTYSASPQNGQTQQGFSGSQPNGQTALPSPTRTGKSVKRTNGRRYQQPNRFNHERTNGQATPNGKNSQTAENQIFAQSGQLEQNGQNAAHSEDLTKREELSPIAIAAMQAQGIATSQETPQESGFELRRVRLERPYQCQTRLAAMLTAEAHSSNSNGRATSGYGAAVQLETELSPRFAVAAGLQYSQRSYTLDATKTVDNSGQDGALHLVEENRQTHLSVVQIPVAAQYAFYKDKKWRAYLSVGLSANMILARRYAGTERTSMAQADGSSVRVSSEINPADQEQGLLQAGGGLRNNAYLAANIGLGMERQLDERFTLFMQPSFQQSLTRFGQERDHSSVFALNMGLRTNL